MINKPSFDRRSFIKTSTAIAAGIGGLSMIPQFGYSKNVANNEGIHIIGPRDGFSPQVGTLLSTMEWMRFVVLRSVEGLKQSELDHLHDAKSNSIGAMLLHLAATETMYQVKTFENRSYNEQEREEWDAAMRLGDLGRDTIKGNDLDYYIDKLNKSRAKTIEGFKQRNDEWLFEVDPNGFQNQPTNNYCKWFHVCEHESNHNGQIKWIKSRLPGASSTED